MPLGAACVYLLLVAASKPAAPPERDRRVGVVLLAAYVVMKGGYNLVLVPLSAQGHWYFPLSIEITNVIVALAVARVWRASPAAARTLELDPAIRARATRFFRALGAALGAAAVLLLVAFAKHAHEAHGLADPPTRRRLLVLAIAALVAGGGLVALAGRAAAALERTAARGRPVSFAPAAAVLAVLFVVVSGSAVVNQKIDGRAGDVSYDFWKARHDVDAALVAAGASGRVFEWDDGIMGYSLGAPTMNAVGLSVDRDAARAFATGRCFDVAYQRGFDVISSVTYWSYLDEQRRSFVPPRTDAEILAATPLPDCGRDRFTFKVLLDARIGRRTMYFLEFAPKPDARDGRQQ